MNQHVDTAQRTRTRLAIGAVALALTAGAGSAAVADTESQVSSSAGTTQLTLTATNDGTNSRITDDNQGFSVESADFAHGYLTEQRMSERLQTLGPYGVIRIGGYSMDLVWPAFGEWSDAPAPEVAIGGTVDQTDLDALDELLDDSGWQVTLGAPLKGVIDPALLKDPAKDPSPRLTLDQVVAEVKAAHETLGEDLLAVELGNEYDNVTKLTGAQYYDLMKEYQAAIHEAVPDARLKMTGPSANTARTNLRLEEFVTAVEADTSTRPSGVLHELASHWYPGSHCGSSTMTIPQLMSTTTHTNTRAKLQGILDNGARLEGKIPSVINESNSASCSGMPGVSDAYASSLWSLDYLLQTIQSGVGRVQFHTNTAAVCGDFKPRNSPEYPVSYRYYGAFCAADQAAMDAGELSATPLYYGIWAFRQVPEGRFVDLDLPDSALEDVRAYGVKGRHGSLTIVLINVQDPASADSTEDVVSLNLPASYHRGHQVLLESADAVGLASLDASSITLGGQSVLPDGEATGQPVSTRVDVDGRTSTVSVPAGTASIVTFSR